MNKRNKQYDELLQVLKSRYLRYLKTTFYFKDPSLRGSFEEALNSVTEQLTREPIDEYGKNFTYGRRISELVTDNFPDDHDEMFPVFANLGSKDAQLYEHQDQAIMNSYEQNLNTIVATGTASGKTECFLYPILMDLYKQYLSGDLDKPGVRALILYPMNALANDQRDRLRVICEQLKDNNSGFAPTFGQYIGETRRKKSKKDSEFPYEKITRDVMQESPPHILLTNYSMLEYMLIRPVEKNFFDKGEFWKYIVLDEAHQYKGVKGIEMGMLLRRLKNRIKRGGGREFRCIATSATLTTKTGKEENAKVAMFATQLFGEKFDENCVITIKNDPNNDISSNLARRHFFMKALDGAYLVHVEGKDMVRLNKKSIEDSVPIEIALCKECGQHYYVGKDRNNKIVEANRDYSSDEFGVEYFMPINDLNDYELPDSSQIHVLNRQTAELMKYSNGVRLNNFDIVVIKCENQTIKKSLIKDQIKECYNCGYKGSGDPVQEVLHGGDGPNTVIASTLHEYNTSSTDDGNSKVLSFSDNRQDAAFFAWFLDDSYSKISARNLIFNAIKNTDITQTITGLSKLMMHIAENHQHVLTSFTDEDKKSEILEKIYSELLTQDKRISLAGVGLVKWEIALPKTYQLPEILMKKPWSFSESKAREFIQFLLDFLRARMVIKITAPTISLPNLKLGVENMQSCYVVPFQPRGKKNHRQWYNAKKNYTLGNYLYKISQTIGIDESHWVKETETLMQSIWDSIFDHDSINKSNKILLGDSSFQLNSDMIRITNTTKGTSNIYLCDTCRTVTSYSIEDVCPRLRCPGKLVITADSDNTVLNDNHYRKMYEGRLMPQLSTEEHTAQITSKEARERQSKFKQGNINFLSSSTTFEVGVDLGDLTTVMLRNVPPEPFNYIQRTGRVGRRNVPGLAITYCQRNPHDLYHYVNPKERILHAITRPPVLKIENKQIILRHIVAVVFAELFRNIDRKITDIKSLYDKDIMSNSICTLIENFFRINDEVTQIVADIVPSAMHEKFEYFRNDWYKELTNKESRLYQAEKELKFDYGTLSKLEREYREKQELGKVGYYNRLLKTIIEEEILTFLSRKAIIPKYGFPVDLVELDVKLPNRKYEKNINLQRDLSRAISEYAPGTVVVANKQEWVSHGIKKIPGLELTEIYYKSNDQRDFEASWTNSDHSFKHKLIIPKYGFQISHDYKPTKPKRRSRRQYTTKPFVMTDNIEQHMISSETKHTVYKWLEFSNPTPAEMIVICEGKQQGLFYICDHCGAGSNEYLDEHKNSLGQTCTGVMRQLALGHKFTTNVVKINHTNQSISYSFEATHSFAQSLLYGLAETLDVPDNDLNVTVAKGKLDGTRAIVLYDNAPGGAGLVDNLTNTEIIKEVLENSLKRVEGECGCNSSCYGCLRSYRNQYLHDILDKNKASEILLRLLQ